MDFAQKIKEIGKSGICPDENFALFLPNYPVLKGSEFIFKIGWANSKKYIDDEIEYFVKGLHLIEEAYKTKADNDFGFGSPSPSFMIIQSYAEYDYQKAVGLEKWVAINGGNYYIKIVSKPEEFCSRIETKSMIKVSNEIKQKEKERNRIAKIEARKIISEPKIKKHNKKVKFERAERIEIANLPIEQLLNKIIEDKAHPIYFYENEILKINKSQITVECKLRITDLVEKITNKSNRITRKIIKHLTAINSLIL